MAEPTQLGGWLKQRRKALDLTQDALAKRMGYATSTVRKIEAGALRPSEDVARRLAQALELDPADIPAFIVLARGTPPEPPRPSAVAPRPLPYAPLPLIGRERERAAIIQLLHGKARLLTLTGPAGVGKTRLAVQSAGELSASFAGTVCFVDLASCAEPSALPARIAAGLAVDAPPDGAPLAAIAAALGSRPALVILDTMDRLAAAGGDLAALLRSCPGLAVLATSRVPLNAPDETTLPIDPWPAPDPALPWSELGSCAPAAFFIACARLRVPDFALTPENAPAIARLCARAEGLPLTLALLASRVRLLTPGALLERFETLIHAVSLPQQDGAARHRSLRAAAEWSYRLLPPDAQRLFRRLGVCAAPCDAATAAALYADTPAEHAQVPHALETLKLHHLLAAQEGGRDGSCVALAPWLRPYALAYLAQAGEQALLEARYAAHGRRLAMGGASPGASRRTERDEMAAGIRGVPALGEDSSSGVAGDG